MTQTHRLRLVSYFCNKSHCSIQVQLFLYVVWQEHWNWHNRPFIWFEPLFFIQQHFSSTILTTRLHYHRKLQQCWYMFCHLTLNIRTHAADVVVEHEMCGTLFRWQWWSSRKRSSGSRVQGSLSILIIGRHKCYKKRKFVFIYSQTSCRCTDCEHICVRTRFWHTDVLLIRLF